MFKLRSECLQCIVDSFLFSFRKVAIRLDFSLNVLELSFELLLAFDSFHEHDVVVTVHLSELVVHCLKRLVVILLVNVAEHVLFGELAFLGRHTFSQ